MLKTLDVLCENAKLYTKQETNSHDPMLFFSLQFSLPVSRHAAGNAVKLLFRRSNPYCEGHLWHWNTKRLRDIVLLKSHPFLFFECKTENVVLNPNNLFFYLQCDKHPVLLLWVETWMRLYKQQASQASIACVFRIYRAPCVPVNEDCLIPHKDIFVLASTNTTIHSALSCFVLRHTSFHTYNIPEEANTGWGCGWCVWRTWLDTSVEQSSRLVAGVPAAPLSALWHFSHTRTTWVPCPGEFFSVSFYSSDICNKCYWSSLDTDHTQMHLQEPSM